MEKSFRHEHQHHHRKEIHMKMTTRIITVAALIVASGLAPHVALSQQPGIKRTDLQRHDLGVPGREVVQVRVDFAPGVAFGKHSHPGDRKSTRLNSSHGSISYAV